MSPPSNPDLAAIDAVTEVLKQLTVEYPDGDSIDFSDIQIDQGFVTNPTRYPYVTIHTGEARAKIARLGRGEEMVSRDIEVDVLVCIEHENPNSATEGYRQMTALRWQSFTHLLKNRSALGHANFTNLEESLLESVVGPDDGGMQAWGFIGVVMIPFSVTFRGV